MYRIFYTLLASIFLFFGVYSFVFGIEKTEMYFFWGEGCQYCANAKPFVEGLKKKYPQLDVKSYEIYNNDYNNELLNHMVAAYGSNDMGGVPAFFIGDNAFSGYHESMNGEFQKLVESCINFKCVSPMDILLDFQNNDNSSVLNVDNNSQSNTSSTFIFSVIFGFFIWLIYYAFVKNSEKA